MEKRKSLNDLLTVQYALGSVSGKDSTIIVMHPLVPVGEFALALHPQTLGGMVSLGFMQPPTWGVLIGSIIVGMGVVGHETPPAEQTWRHGYECGRRYAERLEREGEPT
jgi:hypothetical protein